MKELRETFYELETKYKDIAGVLKGVFEDKIGIKNIAYVRITYRIKTWESFIDKVNRKKCESPFSEIKDICGFRIILRNSNDLYKIVEIITREFDVKKSEDKNEDLKPDQFGYRSYHVIISIKKSWMEAPQFRNSDNLFFEIQIRSELMDAWANISHQIFYKKRQITKDVIRRLYRLSALMEIGDSEISQLIFEESKNHELTHKMKELQEILDLHLPERKKSPENPLALLLDEMQLYNFSIETLKWYLEKMKDKLFEIEEEAFSEAKLLPEVESRWWQIGVVRGLMYLTIDEYWLTEGKKYSEHFVSVIESRRKTFKIK